MKPNLKKFKRVKSDDKSITLRHDDGHEVRLAHSKLKEETRKQLESLPEVEKKKHGKVSVKDTEDRRLGNVQVEEMPESDGYGDVIKMASGGKVQQYAFGDEVTPNVMDMPSKPEDPIQKAKDEELKQIQARYNVMETPGPFEGTSPDIQADGFEPSVFKAAIDETAISNEGKQAKLQAESDKIRAENELRIASGREPLSVPEGMSQPAPQGIAPEAQPEAAQGIAPESQAAPAQNPNDPMSRMQDGYNEHLGGIYAQVDAQKQLADQQQAAINTKIEADKIAMDTFKQEYSEVEAEGKAIENEIRSGQLDPNKFWTGDPKTGAGGHSKIMTGIGMIIAGFNPTNSPNAAIKFLEYQMDQDMKAQERNLSSKENLLASNFKRLGNMRDAQQMTRIQQNEVLSNQLQMAAAKASTPMAKAAAMQAAGAFKQQAAAQMQKFAATRTANGLMQAAQGNPSMIMPALSALRVQNPEMAKELEPRIIIGTDGKPVGLANTKEDANYLKEVMGRKGAIDRNVSRAVEMIKKNGTYEAFGPHNATLNAIADEIATDMAKMQDPDSVARPGEVELVKRGLVEAGLGTMNKTAEQQLKSFQGRVDERAGRAFMTRGIKPPMGAEVSESPEIKTDKFGQKWMRGPDGKAVKVK